MSKKFTTMAVEQIKPDPTKRIELRDGSSRLSLIVQPSGAKSYAVRYRINGQQRKLTLGFPSLAVARDLARNALDDVARGVDPVQAARAAKGDLFAEIAAQYLKRHAYAKTRASSAKATERLLRVEVLPAWGNRPIHSITKRDVLTLIENIADRGSGVTANRTLAAIKTLFSWAVERDIIITSPALSVKRPHAEKSRERFLDDGEIKKFWSACETLGGPFSAAAQVMLLTGQRRGEVSGMAWGELDLVAKIWTIPATRTKNGREHVVPLSDAVMAIIEAQPRVSEFVFTTDRINPIKGYSRAKRALEAHMGVDDWTLHDLRRTAASGMAKLDIRVHVTEAVLNHRSGTVSGVAAVYNRHDYATEKRSALEAWARAVEAIVEGRP